MPSKVRQSLANRARAVAVQNLRRSGASGAHENGPRRARDRGNARRAAIRDARTW